MDSPCGLAYGGGMEEVKIETVTSTDRSLLRAVKRTLEEAEEALLCVAFVGEKGIHLIERELDALQKRRGKARLLVTTSFQTTSSGALGLAYGLGMDIRVLNPAGGTFHPKVYLGAAGDRGSVVVGSANLTGGLATNVEAGVALRGPLAARELAGLREWAETLWLDRRAEAWHPVMASEPRVERFLPDLYGLLRAAVKADPVFLTLGPRPARNVVRELSAVEMHVETERSIEQRGGAAPIPAWMFNLAWERLKTHGRLSNPELLEDLRVHRSSAVCAILGRLPVVELESAKPITLRWVG